MSEGRHSLWYSFERNKNVCHYPVPIKSSSNVCPQVHQGVVLFKRIPLCFLFGTIDGEWRGNEIVSYYEKESNFLSTIWLRREFNCQARRGGTLFYRLFNLLKVENFFSHITFEGRPFTAEDFNYSVENKVLFYVASYTSYVYYSTHLRRFLLNYRAIPFFNIYGDYTLCPTRGELEDYFCLCNP